MDCWVGRTVAVARRVLARGAGAAGQLGGLHLMSFQVPRRRVARRTQFEALEDRQMFSAEPLAGSVVEHVLSAPDFWYDAALDRALDARLGDVEETLASANALTGVTKAFNDYGFDGAGQTVAVIDSGIAWDHPNLGGGFGAGARVVGGWDFTEENDANPYDDGPAGSHGTHVAGIVGATANSTGDVGVAPGVDLVALRVFNDQGEGYFSWVETALRWVHTNRDAFANPITAVNLSLGTAYNAATVPSWAMLEDEFAQLKADGIFISVSAGNSFTTYNTPGLSYPAASASVVPVMSVDDSGSLSYFSQRLDRAIAAPGRSIRSTVPDYVGNQNGVTDDWANYSGTSMASPYVAGASVLVREAMQFVGYTNITEDTIYNHMMATADEFFDTATNQTYERLNVAAALDALIPADDYGSTADAAFNLGAIGSAGTEVHGLIGKRNDVDFFRFTATATGTVTFRADTTNWLKSVWTGGGAASGADGNTYSLNVVAGQSYTVGLSTSDGIGYFDIAVSAQSAFTFVDWGTVAQAQKNDVAVSGENWYCVTAAQAGYLTAEAYFADANCRVELAWYDANLQQLSGGIAGAGCERVDQLVGAGEQLFLRVSGQSDDVDFQLTNLVSVDGSTVTVTGTEGDDAFAFTAGTLGATHRLVVNGSSYEFDANRIHTVRLDGSGGVDTVTMTGTAGSETAILRVGTTTLTGAGFSVTTTNCENIAVAGGGGADAATLYDSAGNDRLVAAPTEVTLTLADGQVFRAGGFAKTATYASGGVDTAEFSDSAGDDVVAAWSTRVYMSGAGFFNDARNFDSTVARSTAGGNDRAAFYDTPGDDVYAAWKTRAYMSGDGYFNDTRFFGRTTALATEGGYDRAAFYDTAGNDVYVTWADRAVMYGTGYYNDARGFERTTALATSGGYDQAVFYDSPGNDVYVAWSDRAVIYGPGYYHDARGFDRTTAHATSGGYDQAVFYDSAGDDFYAAWSDRAVFSGADYQNESRGFERTSANSTAGGNDRAVLYDTAGDDSVVARARDAVLSGAGYRNEVHDFAELTVQSTLGGTDVVDAGLTDFVFNLIGQWR
jgi:subtilisin family serine protease